MQMKPNISIYLDTRRTKNNEKCPVKLRVYHNKKTVFLRTGIDLSETEFQNSYLAERPRNENKERKEEIRAIEDKANQIAKEITPFSFALLKSRLLQKHVDNKDIFSYYERYINELKEDERLSTAESYECSMKSIQRYLVQGDKRRSQKLQIADITVPFLKGYERWMLSQGKEPTTVGIYLRPLRALFNKAIADNPIDPSLHPFGKGKYVIPKATKVKKFLSGEELRLLYNAELPLGSHIRKARDFWFFSYQNSGMNITDILRLQYKDVTEDNICFYRTKTKGTTKADLKPIILSNNDYSKNMIKLYGNTNTNKENYVFTALDRSMDAEQQKKAIKNFTRYLNQHLKKLAKEIGINPNISTYWARHSFANFSQQNGVSREQLQEVLGHQNIQTTQAYLSGFTQQSKKQLAETAMSFLNDNQ